MTNNTKDIVVILAVIFGMFAVDMISLVILPKFLIMGSLIHMVFSFIVIVVITLIIMYIWKKLRESKKNDR